MRGPSLLWAPAMPSVSQNLRSHVSSALKRLTILWPVGRLLEAFDFPRFRIAAIAILLGLSAAIIELPMPAEDAMRAVRAEIRSRDADESMMVIAVDDPSLDELKVDAPTRYQDAQVLRNLIAYGAERVFFDKAYADPATQAEDQALADEIAKHPGRVWLGASGAADNGLHRKGDWVPIPELKEVARLASMSGQSAPFKLSVFFPTEETVKGETIPSISAEMTGYRGNPGLYRVDQAIDPESIPTISYADVLNERIAPGRLEGKTVIVGPTNIRSGDLHSRPLGGMIPGVYYHVMGAQTLKSGKPVELGWIFPMLIAGMTVIAQAARKRPWRLISGSVLVGLMVVPLGLDQVGLNVDVIAAMATVLIGTSMLRRYADKIYTKSTTLLIPDAAVPAEETEKFDVYALKINNLADIPFVATPSRLSELVDCVAETIRATGDPCAHHGRIGFEKDTLIWSAARTPKTEIADHAEGLIAILSSAKNVRLAGRRLEMSLGVDINHDEPAANRIANACQAAEQASRDGEKVKLADGTFLAEKARRLTLLDAFDTALAKGQVEVFYQPKKCLRSGRLTGAEALLRWTDGQLGSVNPEEIVGLSEEHGRMEELTVYVIDRAFRETSAIVAQRPRFKVSINISAQTLRSGAPIYQLVKLSKRHDFPLENLILEVTESSKLDDTSVLDTINALQEKGVVFSIDDFGTGRSSLDYLQRVPSGELKIDRKFVSKMAESPNIASVVQATIKMAKVFGKTVVAEGVEDELTLERLRAMECDIAQGYVISPAVPVSDLEHVLSGQRRVA